MISQCILLAIIFQAAHSRRLLENEASKCDQCAAYAFQLGISTKKACWNCDCGDGNRICGCIHCKNEPKPLRTKYVLLTEGGSRPCEKPGLRTITDKAECGKAVVSLGLSDESPKVATQSENDRLFGCRMQSFGSPFWLNTKEDPKWAKPASKVHKAICAEIKYVLLTEGGSRPCEKPGLRTITEKDECGKAAVSLGLSNESPKVATQSENDRLFGCRMQSFGSPFWLNTKEDPKWAKPASKVHKAICAEIEYVLLTEGGSRPCEKPGLRTITEKDECGKAAHVLGLSDESPKVATQSENDRLFGCRMQSFGSPFWLNTKEDPKWAKPASKVHKAICARE